MVIITMYLFIYKWIFRAYSNIWMKNLRKLLTGSGCLLFSQKFRLECLTGSEYICNLLVLSYLSFIYLLLYLLLLLFFHFLTSVCLSRAYYYSHVLSNLLIRLEKTIRRNMMWEGNMKFFSNERLNYFFRMFWASYILDLGKTVWALRILSLKLFRNFVIK